MHFMIIRVKGAPMARIYVEKSCLNKNLEAWLERNSFGDFGRSEGDNFKSWNFEAKKGDLFYEVLRSHGAEHETNKYSKWIK